MDSNLDKLLCERYPKIFRDRRSSMKVTAMCWGFECGDGWFNIIDKLCRCIQNTVNHSRDERARVLRYNRALRRALRGDLGGLQRFYSFRSGKITTWTKESIERAMANPVEKDVPDAISQVVAFQVKEKFGTLRFYISGGNDEIYAYLRFAEAMSGVTCEECGAPGKGYTDGWHVTLCPKHATEQNRVDIEEYGEENGESI